MPNTRHSRHQIRTRVLRTPQTHDGCFTCKIRKIRCDLGRPVCERCTKGNKICGGYRHPAICERASYLPDYDPPASHKNGVQIMPLDLHSQKSEVSHLIKLGCEVLHQGGIRQTGLASSFWSSIIPQLGYLDSLVGTSMAALGAAISACLVSSPSGAIIYSRCCGSALRSIQQAVESSIQSSIALVAACLLLAISEMLMDQELSALSHLQGMLLVLRQRQQRRLDLPPLELHQDKSEHFSLNDEVDYAGAILDIGTASYALGLEPRLPTLASKTQDPNVTPNNNITTIEHRTLTTLHSSYAFASTNYHWRYVPNKFVPKDAFVNQNKICTELFQRLQGLGALVPNLDLGQISRAHILKAQCSACLIYCQNLLEPRETGYDRFWSSFKSIIEDAGIVLQNQLSGEQGFFNFSLDLGVIQPLFFTAIKCRELQIRTEAVELLRRSGREGPFDGKRLAVVAQRAIELEEDIVAGNDQQGGVLHSVSERNRLHSAGIDSVQLPGMLCIGLPAVFSRCRDVEALVESECPDDYKKPKHWEMWEELLPWTAELRFDTL